ncbi:MAG: hydrogenase maturation protease [Bacteroidota bacterium]|jgi:hydrogenase maturation protease
MKKVLVIGYGNTLRGDDAAGIRAAELIAKRRPEIECVCMHQLMPELAEQIAVSDIVIFFDADVNVAQPNVQVVVPSVEVDQPRTHFISPESLLRLSQQLYQRMPLKAYIIGIPASQFEFSEELSESTKKAVEESVILAESLLPSENLKD